MPACPRSDCPILSSPLGCAGPATPTALADADIRNFAPVARIMKTALPENAKIAKEAKECMQECVSEFISFITSEGTLIILFPRSLPFLILFSTYIPPGDVLLDGNLCFV